MPPEQPDPAGRESGLGPRKFEVVNPPATSSDAGGPIDVHDLFRQATAGGASKKAAPAENDVHRILRENLARENAAGLNELSDKPRRRSRRKRDYWVSMAAANLILIPLLVGAITARNPIVAVFSFAGIVILNVGLAWIFWSILDDY